MIKTWLLAIRPKTLTASVAPVLLGGALAHHLGRFDKSLFFYTLGGALLLQVGSNLANDYFDFVKGSDRDDRKGPTRVMQAGLITPSQMKGAIALVFALATLVGAFLITQGGLPILMIGLVSIVCALAYTAGPYPLAYLGLGDLFVFIFFGPVAIAGTVFLQIKTLSLEALLMGIPLGAIAVGILTVNNVRDYHEDIKSEKRTVVVRFGQEYGILQYRACLLLSLFLPVGYFLVHKAPFWAVGSVALIFVALPMIRAIGEKDNPQLLNTLLGQTGRFLLLFALVESAAFLI